MFSPPCIAKRLLCGAASMVLASVATAAGASTVTTVGYFYQYDGPAGAPIYAGTPPYRDPSQYDSFFLLGVAGDVQQVQVVPQVAYPGYEDPAFAGTGTASASFSGILASGERVEFWNRVNDTFDEAHNALQLGGAVTPGIAVGDVFKLATVSFTNGDWFSIDPLYDPGFGPLYAESRFSFSLLAYPDPIIGSSYFPGPPPYHVWNDTLVLRSVRGVGTPDRLSFENSPGLGSFTVDEGITGTVEIWGRIGSLEPVELRNPSAGVTLVPEPGAWALTLVALVLLARAREPGRA